MSSDAIVMQVQERVDSTLNKHWEQLLPASGSERAWLSYDVKGRPTTYSSKDLMAQAHCVAAYLLLRGVEPGQKVVVVSTTSPFFFLVDLALQFLGAVHISLPEGIDRLAFETIVREEKVSVVFVERMEAYQALNELRAVKPQLLEIILGTDEVDHLDLEKLVTFDRVIPLGKEMWRENHDLMKQRKASVTPDMVASLLYEPGRKLTRLTFSGLMEAVRESQQEHGNAKAALCLNNTDPSRLITRTLGYYGAMRHSIPLVCLAEPEPLMALMGRLKPASVTLSADQVGLLFTEIEKSQQLKSPSAGKKFDKLMKLLERRESILVAGGKVPLLVRIRYRSLQRGAFRMFLRMLGGRLQTLYVDKGDLAILPERFFRNMGCRIVRP
jgi:long-chain acyl-CoA synthetase